MFLVYLKLKQINILGYSECMLLTTLCSKLINVCCRLLFIVSVHTPNYSRYSNDSKKVDLDNWLKTDKEKSFFNAITPHLYDLEDEVENYHNSQT